MLVLKSTIVLLKFILVMKVLVQNHLR
jgi:hypothetical protein